MDQLARNLQSQSLGQDAAASSAFVGNNNNHSGTVQNSGGKPRASEAVEEEEDDEQDEDEEEEDEGHLSSSSATTNNNTATNASAAAASASGSMYGNPESEILAILADKRRGHHRKDRPAKKWSKEEDELLFNAVSEFGARSWKTVATKVPGRDHTQCLQRWTKCLQPGLRKGTWTPEEDDALVKCVTLQIALIQRNSATPQDPQVSAKRVTWADVCHHIPGRTAKQCRERWVNNLDPVILKGPWSQAEDDRMVELYKKYGPSWAAISKEIRGRTENAVKIRWKTVMKTPAGKEAIENSPYLGAKGEDGGGAAAAAALGEGGGAMAAGRAEKKSKSSAASARPSKQQRRSPKLFASTTGMDQLRQQQQQPSLMFGTGGGGGGTGTYAHFIPPPPQQQQQQMHFQYTLQQEQWRQQQQQQQKPPAGVMGAGGLFDPNAPFGRYVPQAAGPQPPPQQQQQQFSPLPSSQPSFHMTQPQFAYVGGGTAPSPYSTSNSVSFHYQLAQQQQQQQQQQHGGGMINPLHSLTQASAQLSSGNSSSGSSSGASFHSLLNASLNSSQNNFRPTTNVGSPIITTATTSANALQSRPSQQRRRSSDEQSVSSAASGVLVDVSARNTASAAAAGKERSNSASSAESLFSLRTPMFSSASGDLAAGLTPTFTSSLPSYNTGGGAFHLPMQALPPHPSSSAPGPFYSNFQQQPQPPPQQPKSMMGFGSLPQPASHTHMHLPSSLQFDRHLQQQQQQSSQAASALASLASAAAIMAPPSTYQATAPPPPQQQRYQ